MLERIMDSYIASAILAAIAILSFIYAIVCQQKNKERKEFSYSLKSNSLIRGKKSKFEKLAITYDGKEIDSLCTSKFVIWNSGNKILNHSDMVESKELTISVSDECRILDVEIITCSERTNQFNVKIENEKAVKIFFEYADKKDGIVIQIIHTGTSDDIHIDCKIKGGKTIRNINKETLPKVLKKVNRDFFDKIPIITMGALLIVLFLMAIISTISIFNLDWQNVFFESPNLNTGNVSNSKMTAINLSIFFWVYGLIISVIYIPTCKKTFNMGIPKKLRKFADF